MERQSFRIVSGDSSETMRKLCFSTKFPDQEIRLNYCIFCSVTCKIKFIGSARFMASSLSNLANNLTEGIFNKLFKEYFLEHENVNDNLIKYRCLSCNKNYLNKVDEKLKKRFRNTFKFSNNDVNKFILLLTKGVYLCD